MINSPPTRHHRKHWNESQGTVDTTIQMCSGVCSLGDRCLQARPVKILKNNLPV